MEFEPRINMSSSDKIKTDENKNEKAVSHFEKHRELYENYAGHSLIVEPAPQGLDTFAFDLEKDKIYVNDKFFEQLGYGEQGTSFGTLHEIEHFIEKKNLLQEKNGTRIFQNYLDKLDKKKFQYSGAYSVMDNCISDVRQNSAVVKRTNEGFDIVEKNLYKDVQFTNVNFTEGESKQPLHIQLPYAILNEYRSGRTCIVDERVRKIINELQNTTLPNGKIVDLLKLMTNPDQKVVSMSKRLTVQDKYIWPKVLELLEEDLKEQKEQNKKQDNKNEDSDDGDDKKYEEQSTTKDNNETGSEINKKPNPNEIFKDAYEDAEKRIPNAVSVESQKETLKNWIEENVDPEKKKDKELAERLGVELKDLQDYKKIVKDLNKINPETNESIIDDLENIIKRIISQRLKEKHQPKYPVEEGDELVDPAGWLAEVSGGNFGPKVWEDTEVILKKDKKFGEVHITLICDRSKSMLENGGAKLREQQKALVLFMEALKRFNDILDDEEINLEKPLSILSEIYSFQSNSDDAVPIKKMGKILSEKDRITACAKVSGATGSTTDYVTLGAVDKSIDSDLLEKIKEGEIKKIVIVWTDGGSDDAQAVQSNLIKLRDKGVIVTGVGITEDGKPALTTYAPNAVLAKEAKYLPTVLAEILKEHLSNV